MADETVTTDSSNVIVSEPKKLMTLDEYEERTAHLGENATSLLKAVANNQTQVNAITTQATQLATYASNVAEQASLSFSKKTWSDTATSGTPITATELNRLETAIDNLTTAVNNLQDSVSQGSSMVIAKKSGYIEFARVGRLVTMTVYNVSVTLNGSWAAQKLCNIPKGYCTRDQIRQKAVVTNSDNDYSSCFLINSSNELFISNLGGTGINGTYSFSCTASWATPDAWPA